MMPPNSQQERYELRFSRTDQKCGFTNELSAFDGSSEPSIRELLQNSVDAADRAKRDCARVSFIFAEIASDDVPGLADYKSKFKAARKSRKAQGDAPTADELMIVERIEAMLEPDPVPLLICVDNGHGFNGKRMSSVLTNGNSDKADGGGGSFGIGHNTAFSATDLRYVLYAGRYGKRHRPLFSGHAVLATDLFRYDKDAHRSADGFVIPGDGKALLFDGDANEFSAAIPQFLARHLPSDDTGAAVCAVGFNRFRTDLDDHDLAKLITQVAAANFAAALVSGHLQVTVERDGRDEPLAHVDRDSVRAVLEEVKDKSGKKGHIAPRDAYAALDVMEHGEPVALEGTVVELHDGVRVTWASPPSHAASWRVMLWRNGMWITSDKRLWIRQFTKQPPFLAVVELTDGHLEKLIRAAETPQHRDVQRTRLPKSDQKELKTLMDSLAEAMRVAVGEVETTDDYTPPDFALVETLGVLAPEPLPVMSPPDDEPDNPGGTSDEEIEMEEDDQHDQNVGPGPNPDPDREKKRVKRPRGGKPLRYRYSISGNDGDTTVDVTVDWADARPKTLGVRLVLPSGSDATCVRPMPTRFAHIKALHDLDQGISIDAQSNGEVRVPATLGQRRWRIDVRDEIDDAQGIELNVVDRAPSGSSA